MPARTRNPQEYREAWQEGARRGVGNYSRGVERVTTNPLEEAARQLDKMVRNFAESITSGKWLRGIQGVTLQDWKDATTGKGAANLSTGIEAAASKVERKAQKLLGDIDAAMAHVDGMPTETLQQRIAKSGAFQLRMSELSARG